MNNKDTLQALTEAGKAAAATSHSLAIERLKEGTQRRNESTPTATPIGRSQRERLNLYLTGSDAKILISLRKLIVNATGDAASGSALILTALRALDLRDEALILDVYRGVRADDARRKKG